MTAGCNPPGDAGPPHARYNDIQNRYPSARKESLAASLDDRARTGGSRTAELAAVSRARHILRDPKPHIFEDPYAIHLLGGRWRRIVTSRLLDWLFSKIIMKRLVPISIQQLTRASILDNLERLAEISSPGSEIVFDYLIAAECVPPEDRELFTRLMAFVEKRGEPMISRFDPARVGAVLNSGNIWEIVGNESPADHHRKYLEGRTDLPPLAPITWCLLLRRRAAGP